MGKARPHCRQVFGTPSDKIGTLRAWRNGIRAGFRCRCSKEHEGSTPSARTPVLRVFTQVRGPFQGRGVGRWLVVAHVGIDEASGQAGKSGQLPAFIQQRIRHGYRRQRPTATRSPCPNPRPRNENARNGLIESAARADPWVSACLASTAVAWLRAFSQEHGSDGVAITVGMTRAATSAGRAETHIAKPNVKEPCESRLH